MIDYFHYQPSLLIFDILLFCVLCVSVLVFHLYFHLYSSVSKGVFNSLKTFCDVALDTASAILLPIKSQAPSLVFIIAFFAVVLSAYALDFLALSRGF